MGLVRGLIFQRRKTSSPLASAREAAFLRLIRGQSASPLAAAARFGLGFAAAGYGLGVTCRNLAYDRGWLASARANLPVVSIGNLTLGGTGKTPMVEWVARWYRREGVRVAVLSRGYQRGAGDGANDEALVLDENLPDVPHLQDPDRVKLAGVAFEELESELILLDDGFQHRRLARDLDIVLLDALDPFGMGRLFPRGLLREPVNSLRRAGVLVLSRADLVPPASRAAIRAEVERRLGPARWVVARHAPIELVGTDVEPERLDSLRGRAVAAFCGIGNPEAFRRTLEPLCDAIAGFRTFSDHHPYSVGDVADLTSWSRALGADLILTTQKDLVKLRTENLGGVSLRALRIGLEIMEGEAVLTEALEALLPRRSS
jgi:tetraacyldisaccharide 4'-kinase